MDYGGLIGDAVRITWRNKYLWLFGLLPSAGVAGGGSFGSSSSSGGDLDAEQARMLDSAIGTFTREARQWISENLSLVAAVGALLLLIYLLFFLTGVICQGALVESVAATDGGARRDFTSTLRAGLSNFRRVLGQVVLFVLIWAGLLLVIGLPMVLLFMRTAEDSSLARVFTLFDALSAAGLLVTVIFIPVGIVAQFALRELVVGGRGVFASVGSGYRLFRRNLGRSLLVWFIQLVLMVGAGISLAIATFILAVVLALPAIILAVAGSGSAAIVAGVVAALILVGVLAVAYAILGTFNSSYWTLAYLRLRVSVR